MSKPRINYANRPCPECGATMDLLTPAGGRKNVCPACGHIVLIRDHRAPAKPVPPLRSHTFSIRPASEPYVPPAPVKKAKPAVLSRAQREVLDWLKGFNGEPFTDRQLPHWVKNHSQVCEILARVGCLETWVDCDPIQRRYRVIGETPK